MDIWTAKVSVLVAFLQVIGENEERRRGREEERKRGREEERRRGREEERNGITTSLSSHHDVHK